MCETCGCGDHELVSREIQESLLAGNQRMASHNREHFARGGVLALNLMGSPGCGKTALLEATARAGMARDEARWRMAAMSGDLATDRDARRLEAAGIPAATLTTGSACHLDAELVHRGLHALEHHLPGAQHHGAHHLHGVEHPLQGAQHPPPSAGPDGGYDLLFIENVGNLVCPAIYDLGQAANVVALSVTEGEDKPLKYPVMFLKADLVVLTKIDLLPHLPGVQIETFEENVARVMPAAQTIAVSATTGEGIERWIEWLAELQKRIGRPASRAASADRVQRG